MASTERFGKRGFVDHRKLPKGPNGRALCRQCNEEVPAGRRSFCSDKCVADWKLRTDPAAQAVALLERDHGICQLCGLDCLALTEELRKMLNEETAEVFHTKRLPERIWESWIERLPRYTARCEELELPKHLRNLSRRLWEADHTLPVIEGGGGCGIENLRTLCWRCHRLVTRELRARLAKARRDQRTPK